MVLSSILESERGRSGGGWMFAVGNDREGVRMA